jgi:hypothetical protein
MNPTNMMTSDLSSMAVEMQGYPQFSVTTERHRQNIVTCNNFIYVNNSDIQTGVSVRIKKL